jgi:hypothetical protein
MRSNRLLRLAADERDSRLEEEARYIRMHNAKKFIYHDHNRNKSQDDGNAKARDHVSRWMKQGCFVNPLSEYKFTNTDSLKSM